MGAADGGRRRGVRRHHAAAGDALHGAGAEPRRARRAPSTARVDEVAIFAAASRRSAAETSTRRSTSRSRPTARSCDARRRSGLPVRGYLSTAFGCPFEGARRRPTRSPTSRRAGRDGRVSRWRSATRSASPIPGRCRRRRRGLARVPLDRDRAALSRHARDGARQRARGAAARRHDVRRLGRRPRRLPVRAGRDRQPGDRGSALHAGRAGSRNRRQPRSMLAASRFIEARIGHPLASRYAAAVKR